MNAAIAIALCEKHVRSGYVRFAVEYGEPGYDQPKAGILFADWNDCPAWLIAGLERRGFALEWCDEWIEADETSKAYRTSPTSYGWLPYYVLRDECEVIGGDEIETDSNLQSWYVNEYLLNNPRHANIFRGVDLASHGFQQFNGTFETGFHPGQNDAPADVLKRIRAVLPNHDVVFSISSKGQFDTHWNAWTRESIIDPQEV